MRRLLLDIEMPKMSGLTATKIIRAEEAGRSPLPIPIIIVSADFRPERICECLEAGADMHLAKPVTAAIVASALASVLGADAAGGVASLPWPRSGATSPQARLVP